jgi:23S rRNA (guanosine2251-2'-O)-methyltransferase
VNIIYGVAPVLEALRSGRRSIRRLIVAAGANQERLRSVIEAAQRAGIACETRPRRELDDLARRANHQGVIAELAASAKRSTYVDPEEILGAAQEQPLVVLLDGIEDPHNLGAILRTCEGAGVDGVFIPAHRAAGITETVAKTSAGAVEHLRIAQVTNLVPLILDLQERGYTVVAVEGNGTKTYSDLDMRGALALVFGSEGRGVRRLVREKCDLSVSIPMLGRVNSLNVSVASGVVLFEAMRQRRRGVAS